MSEFLTHSKFHSKEEAKEFTDLLESSGIEFEIEQEKDLLDKIYVGQSLDPMIAVKIQEDRFEDANTVLLSHARSQLADIDPGYYLFSFSDDELINVVHQREEWNHFDQALAHKILSDRNVAIPKEQKTIVDDRYLPTHLGAVWLIAEYFLTLLSPYIGIIIGLATILAFKTLKSGEKVKLYDKATRRHGYVMLALGIIRTAIFLTRPFFPFY